MVAVNDVTIRFNATSYEADDVVRWSESLLVVNLQSNFPANLHLVILNSCYPLHDYHPGMRN